MFHLVSFWWIMRTQYITSIGLFYKEVGFYLEGGLTCEELSGSYSQEMMVVGLLSYTIRRKNEGDYWE